MTTSEIKKIIAESASREWFKTASITFSFPYIKFKKESKGMSSIYEFADQQLKGWESLSNKIPSGLQYSKQYFKNIKIQIDKFVTSHSNQNEQALDRNWSIYKPHIQDTQKFPFTYDCSETDFLIRIHRDFPYASEAAFDYLTGKINSGYITKKDYLTGIIMAYEFSLQDQTDLLKRRKNERSSLSRIRSDFQKYLSESESHLIDHLASADKKFNEYFQAIDTLKTESESSFTDWFETSKSDFNEFDKNSKTTIEKLEETYQEKLKLEEPAKYWSKRAIKLRKQGWFALIALLILVLATSVFLGQLLWKTPEQIYISFFGGDKTSAIRWSIVYITLISFVAFGIRAITKVMFSCFHLARDSEERHSLTYFYLALLKDSKVDDKDKQLIMQSLFSRAETGLLKDDSSPTMPNDIVNKFLNKS